VEILDAPGLNVAQQPQTQAVLANTATIIYSYKNAFQHYIKVRCDDPRDKCQKRSDQDPCQPKYVLLLCLSVFLLIRPE